MAARRREARLLHKGQLSQVDRRNLPFPSPPLLRHPSLPCHDRLQGAHSKRGDKIPAIRTTPGNISSPFQSLPRFPPRSDADFIPLRENPRTLVGSSSHGNTGRDGDCVGRDRCLRAVANVAVAPGGGGLDTLGGITIPRCPLAQRRQGAPEQTSEGNFRRPPSALRVERQVRPKKPAGREVAPHAKSFGRHGSRAPLSHPFLPMARAARQRGREKPCHEATSDTERRRAGAFTSPLWGGRREASGGGRDGVRGARIIVGPGDKHPHPRLRRDLPSRGR